MCGIPAQPELVLQGLHGQVSSGGLRTHRTVHSRAAHLQDVGMPRRAEYLDLLDEG